MLTGDHTGKATEGMARRCKAVSTLEAETTAIYWGLRWLDEKKVDQGII